MPNQEYLAFGVIGRPRGLNGQVYLNVFNPDTDRLEPGLTLSLEPSSDAERQLTIRSVDSTAGRGRFIVRFEGVDSRQDAEALTRRDVFLHRAALEALDSDTFYHADVLGYSVRDESGELLGEVRQVVASGHDILVVSDQKKEWMLPVVSEVITSVDHDGRCFSVVVPEGLEPHILDGPSRTEEG